MRSIALSLILLVSSFAGAQTAPAAEERTLGWKKASNLGANVSFSSSSDVVGQTDGSSQAYGLNLKGSFTHFTEQGEWRNSYTVLGATTRTPSVPRFVKSTDEAKLETIYLYSMKSLPSVGPYAKGEVSAPMFKGEDVRASDVTYQFADGSTFTGSTLELTESFKPLNTKESVGFFWKAVQEEKMKLELRAGFGALQVAADGQRAISGTDAATGNVLVVELTDVSQGGLELGASLKGKFDEKTSYEAGVETLTPFINDKRSGDDREAVRLTNIEGFAKISSNITSWASFGYDYKVRIQPQVVDRTQQIHMMVLNINYNLF
ncbi:MAG TPA: hypothetical protein PKC28_06900 [Bdellovibrionales bacterium]|nr:hypothetical protein [Bdellovibrionales bacterium]